MKDDEIKYVVSFSGGKDSTAMLLMLLEKGCPVDEIRVFDTGWEFPQMYEHWKQVEEYTGRKLTIIHPKKSFVYWMLYHPVTVGSGENKGKVHRIGCGWPMASLRWCTGKKMAALYRNRLDATWYIGLAYDEYHRLSKSSSRFNLIKKIYPLIDWRMSEKDCLKYCYDRGFTWGGLYNHFDRVSCFCCPLKSLTELYNLRKYYPEQWKQMLEWDAMIKDNKGFRGQYTVHDLENRFSNLDKSKEEQYFLFNEDVM